MSAMGKSAKHMGLENPNDIRRAPAMPDKATPAKSLKRATKPYGYSFEYESKWFRRKGRPTFVWFKTKSGRDQSIAKMRREANAGRPFYINVTEIDP